MFTSGAAGPETDVFRCTAEFHPDMGVEACLSHSERYMAAHLQFGQDYGRREFIVFAFGLTLTTFRQFVRGRLDDIAAKLHATADVGEMEKKYPLIQRLLQHRVSGSEDGLSVQNIISECMGHL